MISPISQKILIQNLTQPQKHVEKKAVQTQVQTANANKNWQTAPIYYKPIFFGNTYIEQLNALKRETKEFPKDIEYRKNLLINAGKNPADYYKIRSIVGGDEIKAIMKEFNENKEFYSVGEDDKNIKNKTIRANLHIHTTASDGFMSAKELLDKAAAFADEVAKNPASKKEPFTIAITDHDTTGSSKEAIEIISNNPLKYKNLRVILGCEFTTNNDIAAELIKRPADTHMLVYGIDPNEEKFNKFVEDCKAVKKAILPEMADGANKCYQEAFSTKEEVFSAKEAEDFYSPVKKGTGGIHIGMGSYLNTKAVLKEIVLKDPKFVEKLEEKNLPTDTDKLMGEMRDFYAQGYKNNRILGATDMISEFLAKKLEMEQDQIKKMIKESPRTEEFEKFNIGLNSVLDEFRKPQNLKHKFMPSIVDVFDSLKNQDGVLAGIAHPIDNAKYAQSKEDKLEFLKEQHKMFKEWGREKAVFSEVYYQSYPSFMEELNQMPETKELFDNLSDQYGMFKTGGADSHRTNIFKRLY